MDTDAGPGEVLTGRKTGNRGQAAARVMLAMDNTVLTQLRYALAKYSPRAHREPQLIEALLQDLCDPGTHQREISVLVVAVKEKVPDRLLAAGNAELRSTLGDRLASGLWENRAIDHDAARWGVQLWASALNLTGLRLSLATASRPAASSTGRPGYEEARQRSTRLADMALKIAKSVPAQNSKAVALGMAATALAATDAEQATCLLDDAERLAQSITNENLRTRQCHDLSAVVAGSDPIRAERLALAIKGPLQDHALAYLAEQLAGVDHGAARRIAEQISHQGLKMSALGKLVMAMAGRDLARATALATSLDDEYWQAEALCQLATVLATRDSRQSADVLGKAESLAQLVEDEPARAAALSSVGRALAVCDPGRAVTLFDEAERIARSVTGELAAESALGSLAIALATCNPDRALGIARSLTESWYTLGEIAKALAEINPALALSVAQSVPDQTPQLADVAVALTAADKDGADRLARSITNERWRASALTGIARALTVTDPDRAAGLLVKIGQFAEEKMADDLDRVSTLVDVAAAWAADR